MNHRMHLISKGAVLALALTVSLIAGPAFADLNEPGNLTVGGSATIGTTLSVAGASTTNGIANTGNVGTDTLSTTGAANVGGTLSVAGASTTNGIANTGDINNTGNISTGGNVNAGGSATVGGTLGVTGATTLGNTLTVAGATTLNGATAVNNTLGVTGATTLGNTLTVAGATTLNGATAVNNTVSVDSNGAAAGGSKLIVNNDTASLTVTNGAGNTHGLAVGTTSTTLSGGTSSTSMTLDDNGATFSNSAGGPARVTGVADGTGPTDAVNVRQLNSVSDRLDRVADKAYGGIASIAALSAIPNVAPGKKFTFGMGYGYYSSMSAVALGLRGMVTDNISFTGGLGYSDGRLTPAVGVGISW